MDRAETLGSPVQCPEMKGVCRQVYSGDFANFYNSGKKDFAECAKIHWTCIKRSASRVWGSL